MASKQLRRLVWPPAVAASRTLTVDRLLALGPSCQSSLCTPSTPPLIQAAIHSKQHQQHHQQDQCSFVDNAPSARDGSSQALDSASGRCHPPTTFRAYRGPVLSAVCSSFQAHVPLLASAQTRGGASMQPLRMAHAKGSAELATPSNDASAATESTHACSQCGWDRSATGAPQSDIAPSADPFFCPQCQAFMPLDKSIDHFTLLGLPRAYQLDTSALEKSYKDLQRRLHPDKFASSESKLDQERSAEWSAHVIGAYYTLLRPLSRAKYLMKGFADAAFENEESTMDDQELLMEIMEVRERIEEADAEELKGMKAEFDEQMADLGRQFAAKYEQGDFIACKGTVHRMSYCTRILEEVLMRL